jgi:hypothetical protein
VSLSAPGLASGGWRAFLEQTARFSGDRRYVSPAVLKRLRDGTFRLI